MARKSRKQAIKDALNGIEPKQPVKPPYERAGAYIRISVEDKNEENSIASQKLIVEEFLNTQLDIILHKFYIDNGISSFATTRPAFKQLIEDVNTQKIDCIVVKDLSRLGRNYMEALPYVEEIFPMHNIRFISILDDYDSKYLSTNDMLILMMKSLINYSYSTELSAKIKSVIEMKQESGTYVPAHLPYGYEKMVVAGITVVVPDDQTAPVVKKIFDMAYNGISSYSIAGELNNFNIPSPAQYRETNAAMEIESVSKHIWYADAVTRILKNRYYTGAFVGSKTENLLLHGTKRDIKSKEDWLMVESHHEAIVSVDIYNEVQKHFESVSKSVLATVEKEYWAENLYCGYCGKRMKRKRAWNKGKTSYNYRYVCPQKDNTKGSCANKSISSKKLKELVFQRIVVEIEKAKFEREQVLKYEKSLKYRIRCKKQVKCLIGFESEYISLTSALKTAFEKFKVEGLYSTYDFMKIHEHLSARRTDLKNGIQAIKQLQDEYYRLHSSNSDRIQALIRFEEVNELNEDMCKLFERCEFKQNNINIEYKC